MSNYKGPTEGGSGGKRGHSNMEHWTKSAELKDSSRVQRRIDDKRESLAGIDDDCLPNEDKGGSESGKAD